MQPRAAPIAPPRVGPAAPTPKPSSATTSSGGGSILLSPDGLPYVPPAATAGEPNTQHTAAGTEQHSRYPGPLGRFRMTASLHHLRPDPAPQYR